MANSNAIIVKFSLIHDAIIVHVFTICLLCYDILRLENIHCDTEKW